MKTCLVKYISRKCQEIAEYKDGHSSQNEAEQHLPVIVMTTINTINNKFTPNKLMKSLFVYLYIKTQSYPLTQLVTGKVKYNLNIYIFTITPI